MDKKHQYLLWIPLFLGLKLFAQPSPSPDAAEIKAGFEKLNVLASVLYFAAHPDDENTRLITWLANDKHYRTAYLSLTRGDGGQNLIGTEQAEELGLIRTQELLAARRLDGGEQYFTRANDFGFSKTPDETLGIWDKEKVLADAVWVIRKLRPDIIITRFPPDERGGHGHHQASAILAKEAFDAAADPKRFPEQLIYVKPWQAKRLLWNTFSFGGNNTTASNQFKIEIGQYNPLLGKSYGEIAAESRSSHRSQGFGSEKQRGAATEYFETLLGTTPSESLMDGVETSWERVKGSEKVMASVHHLNDAFEITHPERSVNGLIDLLNAVEQLDDDYWRQQKTKEIQDLIVACGGIWMESYAPSGRFAMNETIPVISRFIVRNPDIRVEVQEVFNGQQQKEGSSTKGHLLKFNELSEERISYQASQITQPYWLSEPHSLGTYEVKEQENRGLPENPYAPSLFIRLSVNGKSMMFERPIVYKYGHPAKGEIYEPLSVAPAVTINLSQKALVFLGNQPKKLEITITAQRDGVNVMVKPLLPEGWRAEPATLDLDLRSRNEELNKVFTLYPSTNASLTDSMAFEITEKGQVTQARAIHRMGYDHIPAITWFPESKVRLSKIETGVSAQRIGYLPGAGDLVAASLRELGMQVDELNEATVLHGNLTVYDAIITGVRLYNINDRMRLLQPRLLEYVQQGGTLLVQYNVNGRMALDNIGPYPFTLSRNRVTEENAEVEIIDPDNPALNFPNKITDADFDGWIQERGLYFAENSDSHYEQPLQMHDKGEPRQKGSLLISPYGKGKFVYTSLAFFRQLPAGVPGAYRLFINLLAKQNKN